MTALGTVTAPTLVKEPEGLEVAWTQVANADQFIITLYPNTPNGGTPYDTAEGTVTVNKVAGTGATTSLVAEPTYKLQSGVLYKATIIAHQVSGANTDSVESAKTTTAVISPGGKSAAAGSQGEIAHRTTNEFTAAAYASAGQTKGQMTYSRALDGTIQQTTVDATTSVGATAAARDTADLPSGDMQVSVVKDEGDLQAGEGGGKTLLSDLVSSTGHVSVNPVTGAMTPSSIAEVSAPIDFSGANVQQDRTLHEIDHTKSYVDKSGTSH